MAKPHPSYLALGDNTNSIKANYLALFVLEIEPSTIDNISNAAKFNM